MERDGGFVMQQEIADKILLDEGKRVEKLIDAVVDKMMVISVFDDEFDRLSKEYVLLLLRYSRLFGCAIIANYYINQN